MTSRVSLISGLIAPPVITLTAHELIYLASMQACHAGTNPYAHAVPAVALVLVIASVFMARRDIEATREEPTPAIAPAKRAIALNRTRLPHAGFIAAMGLSIGLLCILILCAQWLVLVFYGTCTRIVTT